jgi:hypothetical protein
MDKQLGGYVTIEFKTPDGTRWEQRSMHMQTLDVKLGDKVQPGQTIGKGMGKGDIFKDKTAGPAHVHSEFRRDGRPVEPYSGKELDFNGKADIAERKSDLNKAQKEVAKSERQLNQATQSPDPTSGKAPSEGKPHPHSRAGEKGANQLIKK